MSRTDTDDAKRAKLRKDSEDPTLTKSKTDRDEPIFAMPIKENPDPKRA
jgi:hypothetical protein